MGYSDTKIFLNMSSPNVVAVLRNHSRLDKKILHASGIHVIIGSFYGPQKKQLDTTNLMNMIPNIDGGRAESDLLYTKVATGSNIINRPEP